MIERLDVLKEELGSTQKAAGLRIVRNSPLHRDRRIVGRFQPLSSRDQFTNGRRRPPQRAQGILRARMCNANTPFQLRGQIEDVTHRWQRAPPSDWAAQRGV
jgi:hypothetical protein